LAQKIKMDNKKIGNDSMLKRLVTYKVKISISVEALHKYLQFDFWNVTHWYGRCVHLQLGKLLISIDLIERSEL